MKYEIIGGQLPAVTCYLQQNEKMITERGSMCWMSPNMKMETNTGGGFGKAIGRMFAGDSIFQNVYTAIGGEGSISFASSFPGSIKAIDVSGGNDIIVQKSAFLAGEEGVNLSVFFQKKISAALFGGEGFIMQKLSGSGTVFVEIDGYAVEKELAAGESVVIDTGYLAAMSATCKMEIKSVPGVKNMIFGGEGIFNTVVTGPGKIILQTMPVSSVAGSILPYMGTK